VTESKLEPTRIVTSDLGKAGGVALVQPSVRSVAVPAKSGEKYGTSVRFATFRRSGEKYGANSKSGEKYDSPF
jgi:hypothetical protein